MTRFVMLAAVAAVGCSQTKSERTDPPPAPPSPELVPAAHAAPPTPLPASSQMRSYHPNAGFG